MQELGLPCAVANGNRSPIVTREGKNCAGPNVPRSGSIARCIVLLVLSPRLTQYPLSYPHCSSPPTAGLPSAALRGQAAAEWASQLVPTPLRLLCANISLMLLAPVNLLLFNRWTACAAAGGASLLGLALWLAMALRVRHRTVASSAASMGRMVLYGINGRRRHQGQTGA